MSAPKLSQIDLWIQQGELPKALQGLREWARAYLPELESDTVEALRRIHTTIQDRNKKLISQEDYSVECNYITKVALGILAECRLSGKNLDESYALQDFHKHTCDRMPQFEKFEESRLLAQARKARFFYLYGGRYQSHEGFFERIWHELQGSMRMKEISRKVKKIDFTLEPSSSSQVYRTYLLRELFERFGVAVNRQEPLLDKSLKYLRENSPQICNLDSDDCVCTLITIQSYDWHPVHTPNLVRWFIYDFAREELPTESPDFYFFLGVKFEDSAAGDAIRTEVEAALDERRILEILPELDQVEFADIRRWFNKYRVLEPKEKERDKLMESHFQRNIRYDMVDVEEILEKIIHEFNNKHLR